MSTSSPSSSVIASSPSSKPFNSCSSLSLLHFVPRSYRFLCDTRATHGPCQLKTGPVSSRHTDISMVHTPLFTIQLDDCAVSIVSNVPILFIQHHDIACTTFLNEIKSFTTFALLKFMHLCTPSSDLNGMVFSPKSLILCPFAATISWSSFTLGNISAGIACPAAPVSIVALMFTHLSFTLMTFLGRAPEMFSTLSNDSWSNFFSFNFVFLQSTFDCATFLVRGTQEITHKREWQDTIELAEPTKENVVGLDAGQQAQSPGGAEEPGRTSVEIGHHGGRWEYPEIKWHW